MFYKSTITFIILSVFFFSKTTIAQNLPEFKTYSKKEGCLIFDGNLMYDDDGYLWLFGKTLELADVIVDGNEREQIIQRFDGNQFYTVPIPKYQDNYPLEMDLKRVDADTFVTVLSWEKTKKLYTINTKTLVFTEIQLPEIENIKQLQVFPLNKTFFLFSSNTENIEIYKYNLQKKEFTLTYSKPILFSNIGFFNNLIPFKNVFILDERVFGTSIFRNNGTFLSTVKPSDLGVKNSLPNSILNVEHHLNYKNIQYIKFSNIDEYYQYHEISNTWSTLKLPTLNQNNQGNDFSSIISDDKNNYLQLTKNINNLKVTRYLNDFSYSDSFLANFKSFTKNYISKDLSKELVVLDKGILYQYNFQKNNIQTFLQDKSIRGILELEDSQFLVATDMSGWYTINTNTKETKLFTIFLDGKNYVPTQLGNLFQDEKYFWGRNNLGILRVDKRTREAKNFVLYPITDMIQEDENTFYYGTYNYSLMSFDKKSLQNEYIVPTKEYDIQGLLKIDDAFYMACIEGLLIYKNQQLQLVKPSEIKGEFEMISILNNDDESIYLGNRSGILYQYHIATNSFTELYRDDLKASIGTMISENKEVIWLNTYKGFVSLNLTTKKYQRFGIEDGFSFYEANKYSSLKTKSGHFLIGTLNGVNYFNPKNIKKNISDASLKLTSVSYFNKDINKEITQRAPANLEDLKEITLAPESRNLLLNFSLFNFSSVAEITYRYRLNENEPWINLAEKTTIRIYNLAANTYNLEIQALNISNEPIANSIQLQLKVAEFFYKTAWFYLFVTLFFFSIGYWYYREQQQKNKLQQQVTQDIINAQEEERTRLALELHDGVGQQLMLLTRKSKSLQNESLESLATDTLSNLRNISQGLHPVVLNRFGFTAAIEELINDIDENSNIFFTIDIVNIDAFLTEQKALHMYRMLQEILNNMLKYSEAKAASVTIEKNDKLIICNIEDNGKGFDVEKTKKYSKSLGMKSLNERSKIINAQLIIDSQLNKGTQIIIKVPA